MKKMFLSLLLIGLLFPCSYADAVNDVKPQQGKDTIDYFNLSFEDLMNLEIVAVSKKAESSFDAPLSSTVITRSQIIKSGATTIEEVFRLVPGFIVREESNGNYDVHIRGNDNIPPGNFTFFSENTMTLVMIDGRKVFNNMNGGTFWETFPISITDIDRIEIIRGASTALYGPNAVSGVINIITKKPEDKIVSADGNIQGGNAGTIIGDFGVNSSMANNKVKVRISGNYEKRDRFDSDFYGWISGKYEQDVTKLIDYTTGSGYSKDSELYSDRDLAKDRHGVNAWVSYDASDKVSFSVSGGYQNSLARTVFMESSTTPLTKRSSETYYFNSMAKIHGLSLQASGNFGNQDMIIGFGDASKYDIKNIDAIAEYDWTLLNDKLTIRPGLSYQHIEYSDLPYAGESGEGYLNSAAVLDNFSYYLRGDYRPTGKLRFIAALRMDNYNIPNDNYFTYQAITTYKPNDNNIFRISYARANRGPVMIDSYASFNTGSPASGFYAQYLGEENLKLATNDLIELGYRSKLFEHLQLDLVGFYSKTKDFTSFEPSVTAPSLDQPYVHVVYQYQNIDAKSEQIGGTFSILYAPSTKLSLNFFGTVQHTELKDFDVKEQPMIVDPDSWTSTNPIYKREDVKHDQTPTFFGGFYADYTPIEKLNIFTSFNYTTKQHYQHDYKYSQYAFATDTRAYGESYFGGNFLMNAKISYKIFRNNSLFFNARNVFGAKEPEFGFADHRKGLYLVGININL